MIHREITEQFEKLLKLNTYFKEVEKRAGGQAAAAKKKLDFPAYIASMRQYDRGNNPSGRLDNELHSLAINWDAKSDFLHNGIPADWLLKFSKVTGGKSQRMNKQLLLAEALEIQNLFKVESDSFKTENVERVREILKRLKK